MHTHILTIWTGHCLLEWKCEYAFFVCMWIRFVEWLDEIDINNSEERQSDIGNVARVSKSTNGLWCWS